MQYQPQFGQHVAQTNRFNLDPLVSQILFYEDPHRLKADVQNLMQVQRALRPKVETFHQGNSGKMTLFYLYGTVPIVYGGQTYNIPMTIYFDPPYPTQPPRCFVSPTADMKIKPRHKHVDDKGMVFLPYLNQWNSTRSTCVDLLTQIIQEFSKDPPVYAAPGSQAAQPAQTAHYQQQPVRPVQQVQQQGKVIHGNVVLPPTTSTKDRALATLQAQARQRIPALLQPIIDEINDQLDMQDQIIAHRAEVESQITGLQAEATKIDRFCQELDETEVKVAAFLEKNAAQDFDVLEFLEPSDALSRQLLDLIAEEQALDDLLLFLEDNLRCRRVTPDEFMEKVRDTCRKIFYSKELRIKVIRALRARQLPGSS